MGKAQWFNVDKEGLAKLLNKRGKAFALFELVQNAWDADGVTLVNVSLVAAERGYSLLTVTDDAPAGFSNLEHAFTLFAESSKKSNAEKRGRFNLGEKLVIALCKNVTICSTTGAVIFDDDGRRTLRQRTEVGTTFTATIKITAAERTEINEAMMTLSPPVGIKTVYNGHIIDSRWPRFVAGKVALPTEISNDDGVLSRTTRQTTVSFLPLLGNERPHLYEMGIPVVEIECPFHIDVGQKIPLNLDRDNVTPSYLRTIYGVALEHQIDTLLPEQVAAPWVAEAAGSTVTSPATVKVYLDKKYTTNRVIFDSSSREGTNKAHAAGYHVIHGANEPKEVWAKIKEHELAKPAGQVFPDPVGKVPAKVLRHDEWTPDMEAAAGFCLRVAMELIEKPIEVRFIEDKVISSAASFGEHDRMPTLTFNVAHLKRGFFEGWGSVEFNDLLIHELGHEFSGDHLSSKYHDALTLLGARMVRLALKRPELFNNPNI